MSRTLILGAAGTGRDIVDWLPELRTAGRGFEIAGFLDDDPAKQGTTVAGLSLTQRPYAWHTPMQHI